MELGSSRWCSAVLSWSSSLQSSHWCFGVGRQHFSRWLFLCGLPRFGCGQLLEWGWLHLQKEAALLVHCVRIVILFPSRGSGQAAPHSWEAERAGKRAMISQERKGDWLFHQAASHFELALDVDGLLGSHSIDSYSLCFIHDLIY